MSNAWAGGSTREWRRRRLIVLERDGWMCQLCGEAIDPAVPYPHPRSASVHHTKGKAYGDDLEQLVAAHRCCNLDAGDPTAQPDPLPRPMTKW